MAEANLAKRLQRRILIYSAVGIFCIGAVLSLLGTVPLYWQLTEQREQDLVLAATTRAATVEQFLFRCTDVALQITSRTKAREKLEEFNRGEVPRQELVDFSEPILTDALRRSEDVEGIARLDRTGIVAVVAGGPPPEEYWELPEEDVVAPTLNILLEPDGRKSVVVCAPILNRDLERVGTDVVRFHASRLERLVKDHTGLKTTGETILGGLHEGRVLIFFPSWQIQRDGESASGPDTPYAKTLQLAVAGKKGILPAIAAGERRTVIAYAPVKAVPWGVLVTMDSAEVYSGTRAQIAVIGSALLLLVVLGTLGMLFLLSPMAGKLILHTDELKKQIQDQTAALENELSAHEEIGRALAETEERFRRAVINAPIPIMIHAEDGEVQLISNVWTELSGYTLEDIPTVAEWSEKAHGEVTALVEAEIELLYDVDERVEQGEYVIQTRAGETRIWSFSSAPLGKLPDGRRLVISTGTDVTRRRQAEQQFRQLVDSSPAGTLLVNEEGKIVLANPACEKLFGYGRGELVGHPLETLVPERFRTEHGDLCQRFFSEGQSKAIGEGRHLNGLRKDGREVPLDIGLEIIDGEDGELALCTIVDITERAKYEDALAEQARMLVRANADLERSNADLQQFAYAASHDLQEPLRNVAAFSRQLEEHYRDQLDDEGAKLLAQIVEGSSRMSTLIQDLLAYSRVGTREAFFEPTRCEEIVREVIRNLDVTIQEKGAEVTCDPLPEVQADATQMTQLFQNLISNAIKFCEKQPRVHISAERTESASPSLRASSAETTVRKGWLFTASDNGIGIEARYLDRIFNIFHRLHAREEYPGTGVGLAICKRIVERHGGYMSVESEPGEGTTFRFTIPDDKEAEDPKHEPGTP